MSAINRDLAAIQSEHLIYAKAAQLVADMQAQSFTSAVNPMPQAFDNADHLHDRSAHLAGSLQAGRLSFAAHAARSQALAEELAALMSPPQQNSLESRTPYGTSAGTRTAVDQTLSVRSAIDVEGNEDPLLSVGTTVQIRDESSPYNEKIGEITQVSGEVMHVRLAQFHQDGGVLVVPVLATSVSICNREFNHPNAIDYYI